jgi:hypothetical protein
MATILFFDDWAVQAAHNVRRVMGAPTWVPEGTLEDELTEGTYNFPFVWRDADDGTWKAIYGAALTLDGKEPVAGIHGHHVPRAQALMYAESTDGVAWSTPDVRERATHAHRAIPGAPNTVYSVAGHLDGLPVFIDPKDADGTGALKYLYTQDGRQGMAASRDGIAWTDVDGVEVGDYAIDTPLTAYYNHHRDTYCMPRRLFQGDRRIAIFETPDWRTYSVPEMAVWPTAQDPPMVQFYGMPVYRYEHLYIGLLWRLFCRPTDDLAGVKGRGGPIDCTLAYSWDGKHFQRATYDAFIPCNERGEHGGGCVYVGSMITDQEAGRIRFYSGGSKAEHFLDQTLPDAALMLHTMRLDGFFRLESYALRGSVMTRTLKFTGDGDLKINARAPFGEVRARITDPRGSTIPGFSFDECEPLIGDEIYWSPVWSSGKRVADLPRDVRYHIEIDLVAGELYAIRGDFQLHYGFGQDEAEAIYLL